MKYIIFEGFAGRPQPIIFPDKITHEEMREQIPYSDIFSAGYIELDSQGFKCFGGSKTLNSQSRPEDKDIMHSLFSPEQA